MTGVVSVIIVQHKCMLIASISFPASKPATNLRHATSPQPARTLFSRKAGRINLHGCKHHHMCMYSLFRILLWGCPPRGVLSR